MKPLTFWLAVVPLWFLFIATASAQDKVTDQILKELAELRAEVNVLKAEIARLKGENIGGQRGRRPDRRPDHR